MTARAPLHRWWRVLRAVGLGAAAVLAVSAPALPSRTGDTPLTLVQLNLCNSGQAVNTCYSGGRAVDEAVGKIHALTPDVVTLQEICRDDLFAPGGGPGPLVRAMEDIYGAGKVTAAFAPAGNRRTNAPYKCVNGEEYGVGVIHHGPGRAVHSALYTEQGSSSELRTWVCATVVPGELTACTTHLTIRPELALRQCQELRGLVTDARWATPKVIVAGDFNLTNAPGNPTGIAGCVPAGFDRRDDTWVQQVLFSPTVRWVDGGTEPMRFTDHPLLAASFVT